MVNEIIGADLDLGRLRVKSLIYKVNLVRYISVAWIFIFITLVLASYNGFRPIITDNIMIQGFTVCGYGILHLILTSILHSKSQYYPSFIDRQTEAQRG